MINSNSNAPLSDDNFEQRDQDLFNRIAGKYARKDLLPAHSLARAHRLRQTMKTIPRDKPLSMLEVGCGAGFSAAYLQGSYEKFHGIDYSDELINYARHENLFSNVSFSSINVQDLSKDSKFDVIFMIGVVHHLQNPQSILSQLMANLNEGGWLIVNEPQSGNPLIHLMRLIRKKVDPSYSSDQREYSEKELYSLFENSGYKQVSIYPQGFFSTVFAEVVIPVQPLARIISGLACSADTLIEKLNLSLLKRLSWNLVAVGRAG